MLLGINLCIAVKRWTEPEAWAAFIREDLGVQHVQFTFDLLDPWWPEPERRTLVRRVRTAVANQGLTLHSAYVGLAHYVPSGLLDPAPEARRIATMWWRRAIDTAAELGASAVGGPLGTMSIHQAADPAARQERYRDLLDAVTDLNAAAKAAGLGEFLIEPTPIAREFPSTPGQCRRFLDDLRQRGADRIGLVLDTGHALYQPLYGPNAAIEDWTGPLAEDIRLVHLDNTDGQGDPHWGWPHPQGRFDVADFGRVLRNVGLDDVPIMLEVYPRFEDDDDEVRALLTRTVAHCRAQLPAAAAKAG